MAENNSVVVVVGQGYVGLPLAMRAVEVGYRVVGFDVDPRRVRRLLDADSYVEDISPQTLAQALGTGRYLPTTDVDDLKGFDVALITVPTPLYQGIPDLRYIEEAGRALARYLSPGAIVVLESTTYPGTTEELLAGLLLEGSQLVAGKDYHLGYSPERIDPGNKVYGLVTTAKVVSGVNAASLEAVRGFYQSIVEKTVPVSRPREAELAKLIENTFRHVNVALVNELAMFAADLDVDVWEALDAAATKPFGFMRFNPGPGVGGHCLPIDPSYLSWHVRTSLGRSFRFVELANDVNDHMPEYVVQRLVNALNRRKRAINGSRVLLLGLAYKPNTSDTRESPALAVAERLVRLGAEVRYVDAHVPELELPGSHVAGTMERVQVDEAELSSAHAVAVLTDHDDVDYEFVSTHASYVLDTRHRCRGEVVEYL
ncbi:MAG TPA: nucleotide sugar dehydrogenase [Acidimicrobiales bacterium]|nr:nucleotide sugar dehydrogenase [Acidimicrobiales bacterium]